MKPLSQNLQIQFCFEPDVIGQRIWSTATCVLNPEIETNSDVNFQWRDLTHSVTISINFFINVLNVDQTYFMSNSYVQFHIKLTRAIFYNASSENFLIDRTFIFDRISFSRAWSRSELKRKKMGRLSVSWLTGIHIIIGDDTFPHQTKVSRCAHNKGIFLDESAALSRKANKGNDAA